MAGKKKAPKAPAKTDAEKQAAQAAKEVEKNAPAAASSAARKAQIEQQVPLEPRGPGVEHEDHEGGITDSLARKGVRGPIPTAEEREELEDEQEKGIRAPSVRDRQTGMGSLTAEGGYQRPGQAPPGEKGRKIVPVIATRLGQYPAAGGRLRAPGEAFDYVMGPKEEKLPSWMKDPTGALESRGEGDLSPGFNADLATVIEVKRDGVVSVRGASDNEQATRRASSAKVI